METTVKKTQSPLTRALMFGAFTGVGFAVAKMDSANNHLKLADAAKEAIVESHNPTSSGPSSPDKVLSLKETSFTMTSLASYDKYTALGAALSTLVFAASWKISALADKDKNTKPSCSPPV